MIVCARADWTTRQLAIPAIVATVRSTNRIRVGIDFLSSPGTKAPVSPPKSTCAAVLSQPARDRGDRAALPHLPAVPAVQSAAASAAVADIDRFSREDP